MCSVDAPSDDRRGLSPVVGIVLLFGMVLFGATLVAVGGMSLIDTMQTESSLDQAETSMQQVGSDLQDLSFSADENETSVETSEDAQLVNDTSVTLTVNNDSERSETIHLGSLRYEADNGETVSLEGGGVFRSSSNGSYVVSPPSLTHEDGRLSFPVTKLDGSVNDADSFRAKKNSSEKRSLADDLIGDSPADNVTISIESKHYDAWARYLESQNSSDVDTDPNNQRVTAVFDLRSTDGGDDDEPTPDFDVEFINYDDAANQEYQAPAGGNATVAVNVSNDDADGDTSVALWNDDTSRLLGVDDVSVDENSSEYPVIRFPTSRVGDGVHDLRVEVDGAEADDAQLNVTTPIGGGSGDAADYEVSFNGGPYGVTEGETRTINVTLDNIGTDDGDTSAAAFVGDRLVDVAGDITVPEGESRTVKFDVPSSGLERGDHTIEVFAGDATNTTRLDVHALVGAVDDAPDAETRHTVQHTVVDRPDLVGESLDEITIEYLEDGVNVSAFESSDDGELRIEDDASGTVIETIDLDDVDIVPNAGDDDTGPTVSVEVDGSSPALAPGNRIVLEYDDGAAIDNPEVNGSYDTAVTFDSDDESVEITGPLVIGDGDGDRECVDELGDECGTIEENEDENALEVNREQADLTFVGSEIAQEIDKNEVERTPLDVVFTLDRSGSMDVPYYWHTMGSQDNPYYYPQTNTTTVGEALSNGYLQNSNTDFGLFSSESYDYTVTEDGMIPFVQDDNGDWVPIGDHINGDRYDYTPQFIGTPERIHFDADTDDEIQLREAGFDPNEQRINATESFLDAMNGSAGDRAAITDFDTSATTHEELTHPDDAEDELVAHANGGTSITAGIENAIDEFDDDPDREKAIVLLTDGENSDSDDDEATIDAAEDAADENISVYTVGLGAADEDLLGSVSNETGGEFYPANNADELKAVFDQIAGETVQNRTKQIEYQSVTSEVNVGGESYTLSPDGGLDGSAPDRNASNVNDPEEGPRTYNIDNIDLGSLVSANMASYDCKESEGTGEMVTHDGEQYERTRCVAADDERDQRDNTSVSYHQIYTDGDELEEFDDLAWYQDGPESLLDNYDDSLIEDGTFTLSDNQAVILVELDGEGDGTDYALMLLEVEEPDVESLPEFEVSVDDVDPWEVESGDTVDVDATVENVGDAAGNVTTGVRIDDKLLTVEDLSSSISAGASETVEFDVPTDRVSGNHSVTVLANDAEDETEDKLNIKDPDTESAPPLNVSFGVSDGYEANQTSTEVTVNIENEGSIDWVTNAGLFLEAPRQVLGVDSGIEVDADETVQATFTVDPSDFESDLDNEDIEVVVEDSSAEAELSVTKRSDSDPPVIDAPVDEIELEG